MTSGLLVSSLPGPTSPDVLTPQRDPVSEKLLGAPPTSRRTFSSGRNAGVDGRDLRQLPAEAAEAD